MTQSTADDQLTARADQVVARMERVPVSRFHGRVVGLLGTGTFFDSFDTLSLSVVLSTIAATLHLGAGDAGWVISAGFLGQAIGAVVFGLISERLGRKRVFVLALGLLGLMAAGSAVAWDGWSLGTARFVQGLGLGAEVPVAAALLNEFVHGRARGRVLMLYKLLFPAGTLAASLVGALLLATLPPTQSWRVLFAIGALPVLVAVLAAWRLPESPRFLVRRGRTEEAERIVAEMERSAGVPAARVEGTTPPADLARTRFGEIFSTRYRRRTLTVWTLWFTTYFTLWGMTTWLPSLYVSVGGLSPSAASLLLGAVTIGYFALLVVMSATVDRLGRRFWFLLGYGVALAGAGVALLLWALGALHGWVPLCVAGTTLLLGVNINAPLVYLYTSELYPTRMRSWGTMAGSSWRNVAAVVAPVAVGQMLQARLGIGAVFGLFLVTLLVGLAVQLRFGTETKQAALEELAG
ncbi:MFS transporter, putative metabolite:H+ symporter [Amycolatopsis arida]|uniref:MFS transporter, putative metabolite:H+ symporter n=1 Tax=Amycolatopsis arida TaxID=587909 RepID=A0A1I5SQ05_9PSEU|nr:MFS transporter [Amycolatopsis arida]TDX96391.1 putative MFS transporter [Amycolatopsis arida]SFP72874.1 MFS transporter, putative metabolite:H+ symporter [Amycolatopsis arida]